MGISCNLNNREGIINILIYNETNQINQIHTNPDTYKPKSEFKHNLLESDYSTVIVIPQNNLSK